MKLGELIKTSKTLSTGEKLELYGIIYGRIRDRGGWKWLIRDVTLKPDEIIGVRKVNKI